MSTTVSFHAYPHMIETQWDAFIKMLQLRGVTVASDEPLMTTELPDGSHIETYETVPYVPEQEPLFSHLYSRGLVS